mmetsp:Transcript_13365/g.28677  ORF Transcript_13365/g.28677 Transcript_13365/m.28677 type:complete len:238 (-) Transcript_13365:1705-2418(-)
MLNGLHPVSVHLHGSAPYLKRASTAWLCPWLAAVSNGVSLHLFRAWTSAFPSSNCCTAETCPGLLPAHALWRGVDKSSVTRQLTGAWAARSSPQISSYPLCAANVNALHPASEQRLGSAPDNKSRLTASTWPLFAAMRRGVSRHLLQAFTSAPRSNNKSRTSRLPGEMGPGAAEFEFVGVLLLEELPWFPLSPWLFAEHAVCRGVYRSSLNWQLTRASCPRQIFTASAFPSSTAHLR